MITIKHTNFNIKLLSILFFLFIVIYLFSFPFDIILFVLLCLGLYIMVIISLIKKTCINNNVKKMIDSKKYDECVTYLEDRLKKIIFPITKDFAIGRLIHLLFLLDDIDSVKKYLKLIKRKQYSNYVFCYNFIISLSENTELSRQLLHENTTFQKISISTKTKLKSFPKNLLLFNEVLENGLNENLFSTLWQMYPYPIMDRIKKKYSLDIH